MSLDLFSHPFRERRRRVEHRARKQQHEFLPAIPPGAVDLPDRAAQDAGELLEHRVARLVSVRVIDALEAVEITHHAGERLVQPAGMLEHLAQPLLEVPPIVEAREGVRL